MGQPAARVLDATSHGIPLTGVGCPTVFIGGMPAWRVTDQHICSLVNAPPPAGSGTPHGPGLVLKGSLTVMIGGLPAARMGDIVMEAGAQLPPPSNPIVAGCPTVLIGG